MLFSRTPVPGPGPDRPPSWPGPACRLLPAAVLLAVALLAFAGYLRTGPTTSDDLVYEEQAITGRLGDFVAELAANAGRFHHYLHVGLTAQASRLDSLPARKALSLAVFLAAIGSLSLLVARVAALPALGWLTALFCLALYQDNWHHNILSSYPLVFDSGLLCMAWAGFCLWRHGASGRGGWLAAANLLAFAGFCHYEPFLCYMPVLWGIVWLSGRGGARLRLRTMALASLAVPVYLTLYLGFRFLHPTRYAGNALDLAHPLRILAAMAAYSQSALPLGSFSLNLEYVNRFPAITTGQVFGFGQYLTGLAANWPRLAPAWLALAVLAGGLTYHCLTAGNGRPRFRWLPALLAVYAVYGPNFLVALSPDYQEPTTRGIDWYVTSTFSGYAVAVLLALAGLWLTGRLAGRPGLGRTVAGGLAVLVAATTLVNASVNASVLESKVASASRWRAAALLAKSPALAQMPEGAVLVAPDLFAPVNVELTGPGYWEAFLARRSGRHVRVVEGLDPGHPPALPVYVLRRLSAPTAEETVIALARVSRLGPPHPDPYAARPDAPTLWADRVDVVVDATNRFFDLLCQDGPSWRVLPVSAAGRRGLGETVVTGADMAVGALTLVPAGTLAPAPDPVGGGASLTLRFGDGFTLPERALTGPMVFAGNTGEVILHNPGPAPAAARLDFALIAFSPVRLAVAGPGLDTAIASTGLSTPITLALPDLPAGTSRLVFTVIPPEAAPGKRFGILGATLTPQSGPAPALP
ncbi:hypothetical protein DFW101_2787 [Solidesulfovibrio carbinoliphilus subsp. oakridgensis]|uniref:Glycosyltransferase RgtA/B/C/D-like domain-containing protein n=1 Tax=Solidesulfovibrio carbinoliphilus subsp. oakridgensis TaxID=694327 RepID=G7QB49_9BACT|nr:hypothetical protein [Solidesulfovibrio carbinoliphilus]EHJ48791.1 hypothetical protein DFW101_2787 [Solidesulfovibrio carbinoliphilus subsp. oakridgensis]